MKTRHGVLVAALFSLLMAACGNPSSQGPASSLTPGKLDYSGIHRIYDRPQVRGGHPLTVFVGAQYCPYCASMRWPLVEALNRFGTLTDPERVSSKQGYEGFQSIATYDFSHTSYRSEYVTFSSAEIADVSGNPLQSLDDDQTDLVNHLDPGGAIPFVFAAGSYTAVLPFSPQLLAGHSFEEIAKETTSSSPGEIGRVINAEADALTAAICKTDGSRPASVCGQPAMQALIQRMP
jgi:hypothetical protein